MSSGANSADQLRAGAVLLATIAMIGVNAVLGTQVGDDAPPVGSSPVTPAVWAFAIWGLIFLLALGLAIYQALPANRARLLPRRIGWWFAGAAGLAALWPIATVADQLILAQVLLVGMAVCLAVPFLRLGTLTAMTGPDRMWLALPIAVFFGWVTAANVVGLVARLTAAGWLATNQTGDLISVGLLILGGLIAAWFVRRATLMPLWGGYAFAVLWALAGIAANQPALMSIGVTGAVVAAVPVVLTVIGRRQRPPSAPALSASPS